VFDPSIVHSIADKLNLPSVSIEINSLSFRSIRRFYRKKVLTVIGITVSFADIQKLVTEKFSTIE